MKWPNPTTAGFFGIILFVTAFAIYGVIGFQRDLRTLEDASREDIAWTAAQLEIEFSRLLTTLLAYQIPDSDVTASDVNNRFDILWSRIAVFREGAVGQRLSAYDAESGVVNGLLDRMKVVDRLVVGLGEKDADTAFVIYQDLAGFNLPIAQFVLDVTQGEESNNRTVRDTLTVRTNRTLFTSMLATFLAIMLVGYIYLQSRKFELLATINQRLAVAAEQASNSKSRFLSMMSHELRTPMNGVMGLLALAKQTSVQPSQTRLLEQAEGSAQSMLGLLTDIFDYSALQAEDVTLDIKPFHIESLQNTLREKLDKLSKREGVNIDVKIVGDFPKRISGDVNRIRQSIAHLSQYVLETAGTSDTAICLSYENGALVSKLSFDYSNQGGNWSPDLILGDRERQGDKIATSALGPMIARGLIDAMGGTIKIDADADNQIAVLTHIPAPIVEVKETVAKIYATSTAINAICRAVLKGEDLRVADDESTETIDVIIIESGNESEHEFIAQARAAHPSAAYIAIGIPLEPDNFDFTVGLPMDFDDLRRAVSGSG